MALAGDFFYIQGFKLDNTKTSIQFIQSLFENSISPGNKVIVSYKAGAKASDFSAILPSGITIVDGDVSLSTLRIIKLTPTKLRLNNHSVNCFDLENRVLNYLVVQDRESALIETSHHSAFIINKEDIGNEVKMRSIIDASLYFEFLSIPLNETFSFPLVNTHSSNLIYTSERPTPLYLSRFTPYKMEYSKVLLGFYEALKPHCPGFEIYLDNDPVQGPNEVLNSNKISITLEGLGSLDRRPYMMNRDIIQSSATLTLNILTSDQLKYSFIKDSYQNLTAISNLARYSVKDTYGLDWMTFIEWENFKDITKMRDLKDELGRFSYSMTIQCSLNFYIVKDALYNIIKIIDINYINSATNKELFLTVN